MEGFMSKLYETVVSSDADHLYKNSAKMFYNMYQKSILKELHFTVALAGGSTPRGLYEILAKPPYMDKIDWRNVHLFWGDERFVPPDDPESNYGMISAALISKIAIPFENIYPMPTEYEDPDEAADAYETELVNFVSRKITSLPRFSLVLLGLGGDGHTASLFPGSDSLKSNRMVTASVSPIGIKNRLTLTLPVINNAESIIFLVSGKKKAKILKKVLEDSPEDYPAGLVKPSQGKLVWQVDKPAYSGIGKK